MELTHAMANIERGLRLHYVTAGDGPRVVVLLHGFPQTWWEWRRVIPALVNADLKVVAPDYRGAGHSSRPAGGYDKLTMAGDIHRLLRDHLELEGPIVMVGHDIGLMVAYAYAQAYRDELSQLVVADAPLPARTSSIGCAATRVSGTSRSTARATSRRCLWRAANDSTSRSSWRAALIRQRSKTQTLTSTSRPSPPLARCGPASSSTAPSTATPRTTG